MLHDDVARALHRVSHLEGVCTERDLDEIAIVGRHMDDYILVEYLAQLLDRGEMRIIVDPPERLDYIAKLTEGK